MQTLHYADEVRQIAEVPLGDAEVKDSELKLAVQLVEQIATDEFQPENYEDEVRKRYHEAIQRKVEGQEDHRGRRPSSRAPRSSTSWRRSRRACRPRTSAAAQAKESEPKAAKSKAAVRPRRRLALTARRARVAGQPPDRRRDRDRQPGPRPPRGRRVRALPAPAARGARGGRAPQGASASATRSTGAGPCPASAIRRARLLIVGLAPAAHGGNRTGASSRATGRATSCSRRSTAPGFANQPPSIGRDDGLALSDCYVAAARAARRPPNKPLPDEIARCRAVPGSANGASSRACAPCSCSGRIALDALPARSARDRRVPPPRRFTFGHGSLPRPRRRRAPVLPRTIRRSRTRSRASSPRATWTAMLADAGAHRKVTRDAKELAILFHHCWQRPLPAEVRTGSFPLAEPHDRGVRCTSWTCPRPVREGATDPVHRWSTALHGLFDRTAQDFWEARGLAALLADERRTGASPRAHRRRRGRTAATFFANFGGRSLPGPGDARPGGPRGRDVSDGREAPGTRGL